MNSQQPGHLWQVNKVGGFEQCYFIRTYVNGPYHFHPHAAPPHTFRTQRSIHAWQGSEYPLACVEIVSSDWGRLVNTQRAVSFGTRTTRSCPHVADRAPSCRVSPSSASASLLPTGSVLADGKKASCSSASRVSSCKEFDSGDTVCMPSPDRLSSLPLSDPGLATSGDGGTLWQHRARGDVGTGRECLFGG